MASYALVEDSEEIITDYHTSMAAFDLRLKKYNSSINTITYTIDNNGVITVIGNSTPILTASAEVIGLVGSIESTQYLQWIWSLLDCKISQDFKKILADNYDLLNYTKHPILYFNDPMMISYILALIRFSLEYDYILSFATGKENQYICIGIKHASWLA